MKKIFSKLYVRIILITVAVCLLSGAVFYVISWQIAKVQSEKILSNMSEALKLNEELKKASTENLKLNQEKIKLKKEKTISEIAGLDEEIEVLKKEFNEKINLLPYKSGTEYINIQELKKIADNGLDASADFKDELNNIGNVPEAFNKYFNLLVKYLDNNIKINSLFEAYYDSKDYSEFDYSGVRQLYKENDLILLELEQERIRVLKENEIDY
jgi:hypothetical protein